MTTGAIARPSPLQNRVSPIGELLADPARGLVYGSAEEIDARLHAERVDPVSQGHLLYEAAVGRLPDGAFILVEGAPHLVLGRSLLGWTPGGYTEPRNRPRRGTALVITPPSLVRVPADGWEPVVPLLHLSAFEPVALARAPVGQTRRR